MTSIEVRSGDGGAALRNVEGETQRAVLLADAGGRILFCSALQSPLWTQLTVDRMFVGPDGHVVFCRDQQPPLTDRLAEELVGVDVEALLPGLGFRRCVRECSDGDRREHTACAETNVGDVHVAATIRRLPSPMLPLFAVDVSLRRARGGRNGGLPALALALECSADALLLTDIDGVIQHVNPAFESMTGYARVETIGRTPAVLLNSGHQSRDFYRALWDALRGGNEFRGTFVNRRRDGEIFHEEETIRPLFDTQGSITHFMSVGRDVSGRVRLIERLTHAATHDALTDLPNRALFHDRLAQALRHAERGGESFAVVIVDIDRFKAINDAYGHAAGDAIIRAVAARLQASVRAADTVARLGGDEFGLLLLDQHGAAGTERALAKIVHAFASPLTIGAHRFALTVSIGAALSPAGAPDLQALFERADRAMYAVKRAGGSGCRIDSGERSAARRAAAGAEVGTADTVPA